MPKTATSDVHGGCVGKEAFQSYLQAQRAYRRMRRTHEGKRFELYHCEHCHCWHIGDSIAGSLGRRRPVPRVKGLTRAELEAAAGW